MERRTELRFLMVVLAAATAVIIYSVSESTVPVIDTASRAPRARLEPMAAAVSTPDRGVLRTSVPPTAAPSDETPATDRFESTRAEPIVLHGRILEEKTGLPCGHARIGVLSNPDPLSRQNDDSKPPYLEATTDEDGRFQLSLLPRENWSLGQLHRARVVSGNAETLFYGSIILMDDMILLVRESRLLKGRVRTGLEIGADGTVTAFLPSRRHVPWFAGSAQVSADGSFSIVTRADPLPETVLLRFGLDGSSFDREARSSDLLSLAGANIDLSVTALQLQVSDGAVPIEDVTIRIGMPDSTTVVAAARTSADGQESVVVPVEVLEVCLSKAGYATRVDSITVAAEPQLRAFLLERLTSYQRVSGTVLGPTGDPIEDALVTAAPRAARNREITTAALVQTRTDGSGAFELETGGPIDLVAFHKAFGLTPTVSLTATGQHVVLRFDSRGRVFLQLECGGLPLPVRTGQAEYFLVDRWKERVIGGWSLAPIEIDDVPASSYNVFVYLPGSDLYGQGVVTVLGGEMSFASVELAPAFHAKGVVVDRSGHPVKGARLRMERSLWPPEIVSAWGTAETKENGAFDLLAGDTNEATLTGEYAASRERLRVDCGSPIRVTIESGPVK